MTFDVTKLIGCIEEESLPEAANEDQHPAVLARGDGVQGEATKISVRNSQSRRYYAFEEIAKAGTMHR